MRISKEQKAKYIKRGAVAYNCTKYGKLSEKLYDIIYGINDYAVVQGIATDTEIFPIRAYKIYYTIKGRPYINMGGFRIHLDNFVRI